MTPQEFKARWDSSDDCGGITYEEVADCAVAWGLSSRPKINQIDRVLYSVLKAAGVEDAEDYNPDGGD